MQDTQRPIPDPLSCIPGPLEYLYDQGLRKLLKHRFDVPGASSTEPGLLAPPSDSDDETNKVLILECLACLCSDISRGKIMLVYVLDAGNRAATVYLGGKENHNILQLLCDAMETVWNALVDRVRDSSATVPVKVWEMLIANIERGFSAESGMSPALHRTAEAVAREPGPSYGDECKLTACFVALIHLEESQLESKALLSKVSLLEFCQHIPVLWSWYASRDFDPNEDPSRQGESMSLSKILVDVHSNSDSTFVELCDWCYARYLKSTAHFMRLWMADLPFTSLIRKASKFAHHFQPVPMSAGQLQPDGKMFYPVITDEQWQSIMSSYLRRAPKYRVAAYARLLPLLKEIGDEDEDSGYPSEIHLEALFSTLIVERFLQRADIEIVFVGSERPCVGCFIYMRALKYAEYRPSLIVEQSCGQDISRWRFPDLSEDMKSHSQFAWEYRAACMMPMSRWLSYYNRAMNEQKGKEV